ncbi:MAG: T9SS type A sorting domain-containing protein [Bacteroidota bacterium]
MKKPYLFCLLAILFVCSFSLAQPTQPPAPIACNSSNCTPPVSETCSGTSNVVTSFTTRTLRSGSPTSLPALYSYFNIATISGQQINATITVESQSNCNMSGSNFNIDDDAATDQSGNSIASFFAPRITPASNLTTTDIRGYVQFTIRFYVGNGTAGEQYPGDYTTVPSGGGLSGLNYIHYDIDGSTVGTGGWFRETGVVQDVVGSVINGDVSTELVPYTYTHSLNWKGFAGSVCERTGVSRCAQVAVAANYATPQTQITFRMGYDYNYNGTSFNSQPTRQYGSRFGCFSFPQQTPLPVKLLSFTGTYRNNAALLNWAAENQVNFELYEIERSTDANKFESIGIRNRQEEGMERQQYQYSDDLSSAVSNVFYYRLKMMDMDSRFSYSNIIMIRKDAVKEGLSLSPNPVTAGNMANVRFEANKKGMVELTITDMTGKVVLRQQNQVYEGVNSVSISNLNRLQPGLYLLRVNDGQELQSAKLTISR